MSNIDNGYSAGVFAARMARRQRPLTRSRVDHRECSHAVDASVAGEIAGSRRVHGMIAP